MNPAGQRHLTWSRVGVAVCVGLIAYGAVVALLPRHHDAVPPPMPLPRGTAGDRGANQRAEELAVQQVAERFVIACDTTDPAHPAGDLATETALAPESGCFPRRGGAGRLEHRGSPHDGDARSARAASGRTRRRGGSDRHRHHDRDLGFGSAGRGAGGREDHTPSLARCVRSRAGGSSASRSEHDTHRGQVPRPPRRGMCIHPVRPGRRGIGRRHQQSLATRHRQHPRQSAGPVPTSVSGESVRGAVDTARRRGEDRIVLRSDRCLGCGCRGHVPVRAGDVRRVRQADPARWCGTAQPVRPDRRRLCRGALPVLTRGRPEPDPGAGGLQLRQCRGRRARPPRPATPNRCWPPQPATPLRVRECRAACRRPSWPTPSRRSEPPTSTAAIPPGPGSTAPDWWCGPMGWPGWSCPGWRTTSGTTSPTLPSMRSSRAISCSSAAVDVASDHVGIYIGDSAMVDAPHTGADVRVDTFPDVAGAAWGDGEVVLGAADPVADVMGSPRTCGCRGGVIIPLRPRREQSNRTNVGSGCSPRAAAEAAEEVRRSARATQSVR